MMQRDRRPKCHLGGHRPARDRNLAGDVLRSTCADCGCDIFRTHKDRRWVFSGMLGAVTPAARGTSAGNIARA